MFKQFMQTGLNSSVSYVRPLNLGFLVLVLSAMLGASANAWSQAAQANAMKAPIKPAPESAAMVLMGRLIDQTMPAELYSEKNVAWMGGKRSLVIKKQGQARITSNADTIAVRFPVRVTLNGNVDTSIVLMRLQRQCKAAFNMPATVNLRGDFAATPIHVKADVELIVPPVSADCEGYAVAIAPLVQAIIEQQRPKWQAELQQEITAQLRALGL